MLGPPSPCSFLFAFQWPPPLLNERTFWITPFATWLWTFVHLYSSIHFLNLNDNRFREEGSQYSHIQRYFCYKHDVHNRILTFHTFGQNYCNSCLFLLFQFFLKFYYPVGYIIVNHFYIVFARLREAKWTKNVNVITKTEKPLQ